MHPEFSTTLKLKLFLINESRHTVLFNKLIIKIFFRVFGNNIALKRENLDIKKLQDFDSFQN